MTKNLKFTPPSAPTMRLETKEPVETAGMTMRTLQEERTRRKEKNPRRDDLAEALKVLGISHKLLGRAPPGYESTLLVPVPIELLHMVGIGLVGRRKWHRAWNDKQTRARLKREAEWQKQANEYWREHPNTSIHAVVKALGLPDRARKSLENPNKS